MVPKIFQILIPGLGLGLVSQRCTGRREPSAACKRASGHVVDRPRAPWRRGHRRTSFMRPSVPRPYGTVAGAAARGVIGSMLPKSGSRHERARRTSSATQGPEAVHVPFP